MCWTKSLASRVRASWTTLPPDDGPPGRRCGERQFEGAHGLAQFGPPLAQAHQFVGADLTVGADVGVHGASCSGRATTVLPAGAGVHSCSVCIGCELPTQQTGGVLVAVLSDTHAPRYWRACPAEVARRLRGVDLILHAGDVCTAAVLEELAGFAPVRAVLGNNDGPDVAAWGAAPTARLDLDGMPVAMVHDSGASGGRPARLRRLFPDAALVVFGHSHIPWDHEEQGQRSFNPGSPTDRRRQPRGTMGLLRVERGRLRSARIVPVTPARGG